MEIWQTFSKIRYTDGDFPPSTKHIWGTTFYEGVK